MIDQGETDIRDLWLRYWANSGDAQLFEFHAYLHGLYELRAIDLEILTLAIEDLKSPRKPPRRY